MHSVCAIRDACRTFSRLVYGKERCLLNETVQCRTRRNVETQQNGGTKNRIKGSSESSHKKVLDFLNNGFRNY